MVGVLSVILGTDLRHVALLAVTWWIWPWAPHPTPLPSAAPTHAALQIIRIDLSKLDMGAGDHVTGDVVTTPDVRTVKALIIGQTINLTQSRVGHFPIAFTVPAPLPVFFRGEQSVEFVAFDRKGRKVSRTISFHVH
jgi:hypothetical protein